MLTDADIQAFKDVSALLEIRNPQWLLDLVSFETAGTFDPTIKNPYSSARGLLQFLDATAKGLGYIDSLHLVSKHPTVISQLKGPVTDYLRPYAPYTSATDLYLSVFFPAALNYPPDTTFENIFKDLYGGEWHKKFSAFRNANPNIHTPSDYARLAQGHSKYRIDKVLSVLFVAITGAIGYFIIRKRKFFMKKQA